MADTDYFLIDIALAGKLECQVGGASSVDATAIIVIAIRHDLEVNTKGQSSGQSDTWYHGKSSKFGVRPKILCTSGKCHIIYLTFPHLINLISLWANLET